MSECRRNDIAADRALNRFGFCSRFTVRCMRSFAAFDYNAAACYGAYMPVVIRIRLPLCTFGMTESIAFGSTTDRAGLRSNTGSRRPVVLTKFAVLKGCRALFTASTGLVISSLYCAVGIRCLVSIGCNFLIKYMGNALFSLLCCLYC